MSDQRWILRQEQHVHSVFRDEVQPTVPLLRRLGRLFGLHRFPRCGFAVQRRLRRVSGRVGGGGPYGDLLRRHRRCARQPGCRRRSELQRGSSRCVLGVELDLVVHCRGRQECRRYRHVLHRHVSISVASQHLQRRGRTLRRIRRPHPRGRQGTHPVCELFRLGHLPQPGAATGTALPEAGRRHGAVTRQRRRAKRIASALVLRECGNRRDEWRQRGTAHRQSVCLRSPELRCAKGIALHGERGDERRHRPERLCGAAGHRHVLAVRLRTVLVRVPHRWLDRRRVYHPRMVGRRLRHLQTRKLARGHRNRCPIPEPVAVLAEPFQSNHPLRISP